MLVEYKLHFVSNQSENYNVISDYNGVHNDLTTPRDNVWHYYGIMLLILGLVCWLLMHEWMS